MALRETCPVWNAPTVDDEGPGKGRAAVATAPCSFGIFELGDRDGDAVRLLDLARDAGYEGIDLGPPGALGRGEILRARLAGRGLGLAGGWVQLEEGDHALAALHATLDCFDESGTHAVREPLPTLAAGGPVDAVTGRPGELDADAWAALCTRVERAAKVCHDRGYEPTFHHHVGTWVETPQQIDRLLDATTVGLCLDTGHLLLGGGDPVDGLRRWRGRINHVHLKDVHLDAARRLAAEQASLRRVWRDGVFCALEDGDLDIPAVLGELDHFTGWLVVEQDRLVETGSDLEQAEADQRRNRAYLKERGW